MTLADMTRICEFKAHFDTCPECQRLQSLDPTNDFCPTAYRLLQISQTFEQSPVSVQ